jgi:hypothetical protein
MLCIEIEQELLQSGIQNLNGLQKSLLTGFIENHKTRPVFGTKIIFLKFGGTNQKPSGFSGLSIGFFSLSIGLAGSLFKI